jgi:adenine-specific DNA-methyltransferase
MNSPAVDSLDQLIAVTLELGALEYPKISTGERRLAKRAVSVSKAQVQEFLTAILRDEDPLGQAFSEIVAPKQRRPLGATYTPKAIVSAMTRWVATHKPARIVDPGAGSGRFIVAAGRAIPNASLVAVELDPMAALMLRAHLQVAGLAGRSTLVVGDYRELQLPSIKGRTAFLGNPPYVRHHLITQEHKAWLAQSAASLGLHASRLAGLHVHFLVATAQKSAAGDIGALITAAEWLDVNYGALPRKLLLDQLGLSSLHLVEPAAKPFADADTTAVVACFEVGQRPASVKVHRIHSIAQLGDLELGKNISRKRLEQASRWSTLTRPSREKPRGYVELGELCRVHRGQVTGANQVWIAGAHSSGLPLGLLFPSITRAQELFAAGHTLEREEGLRSVIDIPPDLDLLPKRWRPAVEKFLKHARTMGADQGYIVTHRRAWWAVGLREPAPILASYMARRAPAFVRNAACVRHINIAHGIYPRERMSQKTLNGLVLYLRSAVSVHDGRVYAGGLTKFEPREMERLLVPEPGSL